MTPEQALAQIHEYHGGGKMSRGDFAHGIFSTIQAVGEGRITGPIVRAAAFLDGMDYGGDMLSEAITAYWCEHVKPDEPHWVPVPATTPHAFSLPGPQLDIEQDRNEVRFGITGDPRFRFRVRLATDVPSVCPPLIVECQVAEEREDD